MEEVRTCLRDEADKLSEHTSSDWHKRRWEEALEILEARVSPNWGDGTVGAWRPPSGWTARLTIMEQVDA
jgi:hypothetical protein